ncbi:hypothetical protein [Cellulosimicrobium marinum]|uniref:hypothetical protein n=1 Tax=Cellulosimicrobium marinum TaxID=1638992 RepID=UPI001E4B8048|nr:hypothetical protein [Cellulosimicrobium marinum]MCB7136013.1 hypothetical protein [Cellulosimicrobium marinum]
MTRLVLVHGRDNQGLDAEELERTWRTVLGAGLAAAGTPRTITDDDATFVYYGDTLAALARGDGTPPPVTVHTVPGTRGDTLHVDSRRIAALPDEEREFVESVTSEVLRAAGVDAARLGAEADELAALGAGALAEPGGWVNVLLSALDRYVPGLSSGVLLLLVRDVWTYLHDPDVRATLDDALAEAMPTDEPAVVVAHSLGSVLAYSVLREHRRACDWDVPLFLTLGSPLAITAIRDALAARSPLRVPVEVDRWVAVRDRRDALALHGLGPTAFPLAPGSPPIEELDVDNPAPGRHAAAVLVGDGRVPAGYLAVPEVAALLPR